MSQIQLVRQRVCIAIFTLGLSLAAFVEFNYSAEQHQMANTLEKAVIQVSVTKC